VAVTAASVLKERQHDVGSEIFVSDWTCVTQDQIDRFADATGDHLWIHVDRERAADGPFGGTIAHGLFILSHLPFFRYQVPLATEAPAMTVHYGFDRVRFAHPVSPGARFRDRIVLSSMEERQGDRLLVKMTHTIEIEGADKPACVAEELVLLCF
jgi:acyl dehydratase